MVYFNEQLLCCVFDSGETDAPSGSQRWLSKLLNGVPDRLDLRAVFSLAPFKVFQLGG